MSRYVFLFVFSVFISSVSQVLLKKSTQREYESFIKEYLNLRVIFSYFLFFLSTLVTIYCLKYIPLSFGAALESTAYIFITLFGVIFFKEKLNYKKVLGTFLIIIGIILI